MTKDQFLISSASDRVRGYKPDPSFYLFAPLLFDRGLEPLGMVAPQEHDLQSAHAPGVRQAPIHRAPEHGQGQAKATPRWDRCAIIAGDFLNLADPLFT